MGVGFVPRQTDGADLQCGRDALAIPLSLFMQYDADEYYMARLGAIRSRNLLATFHEMKTNVYMHKKAGLELRLPTPDYETWITEKLTPFFTSID
ncbi:hypothetical protein BGAL_0452g00040 [Botrytis galanthina]|uniref:Uncharacterized protein n=1 Tax=Botrytis galanthina TaxID=278940 RepID=A0A4S8QLT0_9HELO|nr:hypothetical protein BGAL_0452g00040 [Botrytis galanthina]